MTRPAPLSQHDLDDAMGSLDPHWTISDSGKLHRALKFGDFAEAFGFMAHIAIVAEKLDHHPEWSNTYNSVEIALITHDVGALTSLDIALAVAIDKAAG